MRSDVMWSRLSHGGPIFVIARFIVQELEWELRRALVLQAADVPQIHLREIEVPEGQAAFSCRRSGVRSRPSPPAQDV